MARTFYAQALADLRAEVPHMETTEDMEGGKQQSVYLGSFMNLDPCGRYHHCLSPNGATTRCGSFWESLEKAADRLGGWIESGEGDPTGIFFCLPSNEEETDSEEDESADHAELAA